MQTTNFKTRLLALLTAVFMVIMCVPFAAFAAGEGGTDVIPNEINVYFNAYDGNVGLNLQADDADDSGAGYAHYVLNSTSGFKALPKIKNVPENLEFKGWFINDNVQVVDTTFTFDNLKDYAQNDYVTITAKFENKVVEPSEPEEPETPELKTINVFFVDATTGRSVADGISLAEGKGAHFPVSASNKGENDVLQGWNGDGFDAFYGAGQWVSFADLSKYVAATSISKDGVACLNFVPDITTQQPSEPEEPETPELKTINVYFINPAVTSGDNAVAEMVTVTAEKAAAFPLKASNMGDNDVLQGWNGDGFDAFFGAGQWVSFADLSKYVAATSISKDGVACLNFAPDIATKQPEETKKTVSVTITTNNEQGIFPDYDGQEVIHFDNLDPNTDQQFELPKVEAKPGYEFIGWHVNGNEVGAWDADAKTFGITGLAHFEEGSNVGYLTIAAVYKAETERTVEVTFSVDSDKGEFEKNDLYTSPAANVMKLTATEFDGTQYAIPTVKAKEGYKFVGWKGQGADVIAWDAEAKTFGVTGLCFFNGDDATTGYATVEAVFEKVEDKKNDNSSSSSSSSASSSSNKTTTASNEKQVVKAAAAPANTTKVLPKTGASNVAPLLGGSLAVVALLMGYGVYSLVLRKKD